MQPVASPETMTCARADPLTPALRASRPVHVSPSSCHSSRGPESTAEILLWRPHACQGDHEVVVCVVRGNAARRCVFPRFPSLRSPALGRDGQAYVGIDTTYQIGVMYVSSS